MKAQSSNIKSVFGEPTPNVASMGGAPTASARCCPPPPSLSPFREFIAGVNARPGNNAVSTTTNACCDTITLVMLPSNKRDKMVTCCSFRIGYLLLSRSQSGVGVGIYVFRLESESEQESSEIYRLRIPGSVHIRVYHQRPFFNNAQCTYDFIMPCISGNRLACFNL